MCSTRSTSLVGLAVLLAACGGDSSNPATPDARPAQADAQLVDAGPPTEFGGDRPATLLVPDAYSSDTAMPLVVALHGFFTDPTYVVALLGISSWYQDEGFLFIAPSGLADADGNYYWNATDACCDVYGTAPDDVTYLSTMITDIQAAYNVDPKRIFVIGHSNGGFMAYRMACERADLIAAAISFAGATYDTAADCAPTEPVSIAQLHGTADGTIAYDGGTLTQGSYPSASGTVSRWAAYDGCDSNTIAGTALDLTSTDGAETTVERHTGCPTGIDTELWTMDGASHVVAFAPSSRDAFWAWFQAHPKP